MPVISKKMTPNGESYKRFLERNERKEVRMTTLLKKKEKPAEAPAKEAKEKKSSTLETPVGPKDRDGDRYGKTLGLTLRETFIKVMEDNEDPKKGHKNDEALIEFFTSEFPNRHNRSILYNIREIRWRYNVGKLTLDDDGNKVPPELQSVKYDDDGNPYEKRKTSTGMSAEEKAMKIEERREVEVKRREEEDSKIEKAAERVEALKVKIEERRAKWETTNGPLQPEKSQSPKKVVKKK